MVTYDQVGLALTKIGAHAHESDEEGEEALKHRHVVLALQEWVGGERSEAHPLLDVKPGGRKYIIMSKREEVVIMKRSSKEWNINSNLN